ncbi:hypothetical protein ACFYZ4_00660 [Streptomyces sp. NPDC001513]|uniref:hypothetical protein n=1 Tax=Streptomyces sp. NPDC001513 TaxID=3364580 RepID=UPI0036B9449A
MTNTGILYVAGCVMLALVTACGSSTKPQPAMPAAELRTHLLPAALPDGWTSVAEPKDEKPKRTAAASATPPSCTDLLDGQSVVDASTTGSSASATAMFSGGHSVGNGVIPGTETLYSFPGDGAHQAMQDMRNLVGRCRSVELPHASWEPAETAGFAVAEGPRLGDESLVIHATVTAGATSTEGDPQSADATVVRVGSSLVVISSVLSLTRAEADAVAAFMPVAVEQIKSHHPKPVDASS